MVKSQKGKTSAFKGDFQWKAKWQFSKGDILQFPPRRQPAWKRHHNRPLFLQDRRHKMTGRRPWKGNSLRRSGPSGKKGHRPCKNYLKGKCTNPSCDYWHRSPFSRPACSGCKFGDKCVYSHAEVDSQPSKKSTTNIQVDVTEEVKIHGIRSRGSSLQMHGAPHKKSGKKGVVKVFSRCVTVTIQCHYFLRTEHRKKPCNQNDPPAEKHGILQKCP